MRTFYLLRLGGKNARAEECFAGGFVGMDFGLRQDLTGPDPDYDVAKYVSEALGATITHADKPEYVEGRVY